MSSLDAKTRPAALVAVAMTLIIAGGVFGAATNAINAAISPTYFRNVLSWDDVEHIGRACVALGIFTGLIFGLVFAVIYTLVVGVVSKAQCPFRFVSPHLLAIIVGVLGFWVAGGLVGLGLAALSPDFFQRTFIRVPEDHAEMLRYAWVGGSIFSASWGGVLALVIACTVFPARWRRQT